MRAERRPRLHRARVVVAALLFLFVLPGARPPSDGTEVEVAVGGSDFAYTDVPFGCVPAPSWGYRALDASGYAHVRHRLESGLTLTGEGGFGGTRAYRSEPIGAGAEGSGPDVGKVRLHGHLALRLGLHGALGGLEVGPAFSWNERRGRVLGNADVDTSLAPLPSLEAWAGPPRYAYAWARLFAGPSAVARPWEQSLVAPLTLGVGHASERLRLRAGAELFPQPGPPPIWRALFEADLRVLPEVWLGGGVALSEPDKSGFLLVSTRF